MENKFTRTAELLVPKDEANEKHRLIAFDLAAHSVTAAFIHFLLKSF